MKEPAVLLDNMRIATPCPVGWDQMTGDERVRRCDLCELQVYDISRMTRREAESFIANTEGRICARLFRRSDGTVITRDCPIGLRAIRRRVAKIAGAVFAALMSLAGSVAGQNPSQAGQNSCGTQAKITRSIPDSPAEAATLALKILDVNGAVVAGASVTLNENTEKPEGPETKTRSQLRTSNDEGRVEFAGLTRGTYILKVEQPGFQSFTVTDIVMQQKELVSVEVTLTVSEPMGLIGITTVDYPRVDSRPGTTIISGETIRRLPLKN